MGRMVLLVYQPKEGKEETVRQLIREQRKRLLERGLVTDMEVRQRGESALGVVWILSRAP
jgi:hypothetical protein